MVSRMQTHTFSYRHEGKLWALDIKAENADDARRRISALTYATYDGVLVAKIPATLGPLALLAVWIRNAAGRFLARFGLAGHD